MPLYGYARVSSLDQDLTLQEEMLRAAGCHVVRAEKRSGAGREGRTELRLLLDFLHKGDTLVVTRVDRLARSVKDLQDIVHELKAKGVALKATEQPVDTGTAAGKAFLDMLAVFAEFETNLRRERGQVRPGALLLRGGPDRLRPTQAHHPPAVRVHGRRAVADPEEAGRSGQDQPARRGRAGQAAPRWRA